MAEGFPFFFLTLKKKEKNMKCIPPKPNTKCTKDSSEEIKTLTDVIKCYQKEYSAEAYQVFRSKIPYDPNNCCDFMHDDLNEILTMKGEETEAIFLRCVRNTKRHQAHILEENANNAVRKLMDYPKLYPFSPAPYDSFEDLYDEVKTIIGKTEKNQGKTGIGNSTIYDACIRLGWSYSPQIIPEQYVYVHGKLIESARAILGLKRLYTKKNGRPAIPHKDFIEKEKKFAEISALHIENLLCIYHDDILKVCGHRIEPEKKKQTT